MVDKLAWIDAGLAALVKGGPDLVRVEPLAKALKVTKGSFYWHFEDRPALLSALRTRWEEVATLSVIDRIEREGPDPRRRLDALMAYTTSHPGGARLEGAVRAWGASDKATRKVIQRVDERRLEYVTGLLVGVGLPPAEAKDRARLLYLALIGELSQVSHGAPASGAALFAKVVGLMVRR